MPVGEDDPRALEQAVRIRLIDAGDTAAVETVLNLITDLLDGLGAEGREFAQVDRAALTSQLVDGLAAGRLHALLAYDDLGEEVGILTLTEAFAIYAGGGYGIIDEMYVRPHARGRGIGSHLLQRASGLAAERSWSRLEVTAPEDDNGRLVGGFYQRQGFRPSGEKFRRSIP